MQAAAGYAPHGTETGAEPGQGLATRFTDPGVPAHVHRLTDIDRKAAKRAERQVSFLFLLSFLGTVLFVVAYFAFPLTSGENLVYSRLLTGLGLAMALFFIGAGAVHWAKKLMPDDEVVEERHVVASSDEDRAEAAEVLRQGGEATGFGRRKMIWGSLTASLGALGIPAVVSLRDTWIRGDAPPPYEIISETLWQEGTRLVTDPAGLPIRADEVAIGSVVHVLPEGLEEDSAEGEVLNEKAKASVLLMRLEVEEILSEKEQEWGYNGIVAYSKICTHMGCPVALYEQQTHHLLCPCHQSTFDVTEDAKVIFGPAARPLPQLAISVDEEGYLVARQPFQEPVGPSFWERG
ncbi:ubiquinol-cytochrome c reductase iron-sulfur subunit [Vallicoccus soli]|uniref:Cytochrome bc1 complex Rieske iron-sulfur subunit n=1 Tax=Vallicoccus soli TaxID=2339232 RepID=A0A3A3ZL70_9ACTN|nr:Rieske 2Fe-2S domain-containing protein [Vallicoccus soli]RJK96896.1 ubiquinol-cytochrome C reductase [Vallicoccus soli]